MKHLVQRGYYSYKMKEAEVEIAFRLWAYQIYKQRDHWNFW